MLHAVILSRYDMWALSPISQLEYIAVDNVWMVLFVGCVLISGCDMSGQMVLRLEKEGNREVLGLKRDSLCL